MGDSVDRGAVMAQVRAGLAASLMGVTIILFMGSPFVSSTGWLFSGSPSLTELVLRAAPPYAATAILLLVATVLCRPHRRMEFAGSVIAALFAGGLMASSLVVLFFSESSRPGTPLGPVGLAIVCMILLAFALLIISSAARVARGPAVSWPWAAGAIVLGLAALLPRPEGNILAILLAYGVVIGFWLSRTHGYRAPIAWFGLGVAIFAPVSVLWVSPLARYAAALAPFATLPLVLLTGHGGSHPRADAAITMD